MKISVILRVLLAFIAAFSVVLVATWVYLQSRHNQPDPLPSTPQAMGEQFIQELADHNYDRAIQYLAKNLSNETSLNDLQYLVTTMESHEKGILEVSGSQIRMTGEELSVRLDVKFISGLESHIDFPIVQEDGVWKITSLDSLWGLILSTPNVKMLNG